MAIAIRNLGVILRNGRFLSSYRGLDRFVTSEVENPTDSVLTQIGRQPSIHEQLGKMGYRLSVKCPALKITRLVTHSFTTLPNDNFARSEGLGSGFNGIPRA